MVATSGEEGVEVGVAGMQGMVELIREVALALRALPLTMAAHDMVAEMIRRYQRPKTGDSKWTDCCEFF